MDEPRKRGARGGTRRSGSERTANANRGPAGKGRRRGGHDEVPHVSPPGDEGDPGQGQTLLPGLHPGSSFWDDIPF